MTSPATIYDIAERAGVSKSTVARVLRGELKENSRVSSERADRIRQFAAELGYRPNWRAKAFSNQRTHGIGLLYEHSAIVFRGVMAEVAEAFDGRLQDLGYHLVMIPVGGERKSWSDLVVGGGVDGTAMLFHVPDRAREALVESGMPTVIMGERLTDENAHLDAAEVTVDDYRGAYVATRHLIDLGHRDVVMFFYDYGRTHHSVIDRRAGFEAALDEAAIDPRGRFWQHIKPELATPFLRAKNLPTGVLCYSHYESLALMQGLQSCGIRVPEDVSIIGFNDIQATRHLTPALTTIGFDTATIGRIGADLLIRWIESGERITTPAIMLPEQLIIRRSTAPPRSVARLPGPARR
jgi:LacI family transcriptional regulator